MSEGFSLGSPYPSLEFDSDSDLEASLDDPTYDRDNDVNSFRETLEDWEILNIRIQYERAFRRLYCYAFTIVVSLFLIGFQAYCVYLALEDTHAREGQMSSVDYFCLLVTDYSQVCLLVVVLFLAAAKLYYIAWQYKVLVDKSVAALGPDA